MDDGKGRKLIHDVGRWGLKNPTAFVISKTRRSCLRHTKNMAERHNFLALRGETFSLTITGLTDASFNPVDLTGHTLVLTFKDTNGAVLEEYSQIVDSMPVTIKMDVAEVDTWPTGNNKYVLKDVQPNGDVRIFAYGSITVKEVD